MINAGRVAIVPKGEYNATTQYTKLDFLTYNGKAYIGTVSNIPIGTLPTDANYFQLCLDISGYATKSELNDYAPKNNAVFTGSISMGRQTGFDVGTKSFACGDGTIANGANSHAEGSSWAEGANSHAEGVSKATGVAAHSEGGSQANGLCSHAEGYVAIADGKYSHASGLYTIASSDNQTVIGKYNIEDTKGKYAFIIGNGTSETARSNALAIKWDGTIVTSNF